MKTEIKQCAYPKCKNVARIKGYTQDAKPKRGKWCESHTRGRKKKKRIAYAKGN